MMGITFAQPQFLYLLAAVPVAAAVIAYTFQWKRRSREALLDSAMAPVLLASVKRGRQRIKAALALVSLTLLVIAMAEPRRAVAQEREALRREGADIMVVLDVSLSMAAEDVKPNRLERAKQEIASLLGQLEGDRIGLVVFAGSGTLRIPLTTDTDAARLLLETTVINSAPLSGTELAQGIRLATGVLKQSETKNRYILLITDGENQQGNALDAAAEAREEGMAIYTLGVGTRQGGPIPVRENGRTSLKKDSLGATVKSSLNDTLLSQISAAADGFYLHLSSVQGAAQQVYREIAQRTRSSDKDQSTEDDSGQLYQLVAALAALALFAEPLIPEGARSRRNG